MFFKKDKEKTYLVEYFDESGLRLFCCMWTKFYFFIFSGNIVTPKPLYLPGKDPEEFQRMMDDGNDGILGSEARRRQNRRYFFI